MKAKFLVVLVLMAVAGCTSVGTKVAPEKAASFEKGKTTYPEIIASLGAPQTVGTQSDGKKILSYYYSSTTPNAASFIPFVGIFAGKTKGEVSIVTFTFDSNDVMESYVQSSSAHTTGLLK
jgi:outer membrane protein assembly factor BamE (lipoprotein component of BamABCDE complex)